MSDEACARNATPRNRRRGAGRTTTWRCRSPTTRPCSAISPMASSGTPERHRHSSRRDGKYVVNTDGPDGKLHDYEIKYAFGVHPLQQYLIELPGGRMQALSIAWDSRPKEQGGQRWFHLYPGQNIRAGDWLHWTSGGQNWNFTCAECHSTNLRKNFDAATGIYKTTWSELNVSCEACHGPGSNHVTWAKKGDGLARVRCRQGTRHRARRAARRDLDAGGGIRQRHAQRAEAGRARDRNVRTVSWPREPSLGRLRPRQAAARHAPAGAPG